MTESLNSSISSTVTESGNTNSPQIACAVHWVFTLNNWDSFELDEIKRICNESSTYYIIGFESETNGTPHLQGAISFKKKLRPFSLFSFSDRIHWEKKAPKASINQMRDYCKKEGHYMINGIEVKPPKCLKFEQLYDWQKHIVELCLYDDDDRTIHWIHENKGNVGKSAVVRYLAIKHKALVLSGKGNDIKYGVVTYKEKMGHYPKIIIIDIPRSYDTNFLSAATFEEIKNGVFFSGKYEGGMVIMDSPQILIFSNDEPNLKLYSADRWNVIDL